MKLSITKAKVVSVAFVMLLLTSWFSAMSVQGSTDAKKTTNADDKKSPDWAWDTDMTITTNPPLPGLGGSKNPSHLQIIRITLTSKNGFPIDRAKLDFNGTAWDPRITQNGIFYMNASSNNAPDTSWSIVLGVAYQYTEPWLPHDVQEDSYDTKLLVTAGTTVKWRLIAFSSTQSPSEIQSSWYNYTVDGAWFRNSSTDTDEKIFNANLKVTWSPTKPMMGDKVQITLSVNDMAGKTKPQIYYALVHVSFQFLDPNHPDVKDMQLEAVPLHPSMSYTKTATIIKEWHYKPGIHVSFWAEAWQEASKRYYHITSYPKEWEYFVSEAGLWHYPPPKGSFDDNILLTVSPNVIQNPDAAITKGTPGCGNVTVTVESRFPDVPLYPASLDNKSKFRYFRGTMLWFTVKYEDNFAMVNETGKPRFFPVLPKVIINNTKMIYVIDPIQPRLVPGEVSFYVEAWNLTRQEAGVLYTDAHESSAETVAWEDPFTYNIAPAISDHPPDLTSFIVWVYDDRMDMKFVSRVNVSFFNGSNLNHPISNTKTNSMGWCYPTKPGGNEPLMLRYGDTIRVNVTYDMLLGGASNTVQRIKATYDYTIKNGKGFSNLTLLKEYISPQNIKNRYIYYIVISEMPNVTANIFFKFNWKPVEIPPIFADVQVFNNEWVAVSVGTIASLVTLAPVVWMLDKRRKKAEEEEKRVTL